MRRLAMFNTVTRGGVAVLALWMTVASAGCSDATAKGRFTSQYAGVRPTTQKSANFETTAAGKAPDGFTAALTGGGGPVSWVVLEAGGAPGGKQVLAQTSVDPTDYRFPLCVMADFVAKDVEASVRFKAVSGTVDRAGGLVIRYRDKDNYYLVRAN